MLNRLGLMQWPRAYLVTGLAAAVFALSSCSLDVFDPDIVSPEDVSDPASLPIAITGAIGDLQFSLDDYALYSGLFADEFIPGFGCIQFKTFQKWSLILLIAK